MPTESEGYKADQIQVLEGLEAVRKRPAMYIGSTGEPGLHHLVYEVVDNSVDEAMNGHCDKIEVFLHSDGSCSVKDNGRGIPVDAHPVYKVPAVEIVMTKLHAGGKFDSDTYKVSGGLHGVGVSVVNALSVHASVEIHREGGIYKQSYKKGIIDSKLEKIGDSDKHGTMVRFFPDDSIFETIQFDYSILKHRLRELAYLNAGISISLSKEGGKSETFMYEGGLSEYVAYLNENKTKLMDDAMYVSGEKDQVQVEAALQWTSAFRENIHTFTNNIATREGGTHLSGLKTALTRTINNVARKRKQLKDKDPALEGNDVREGLTAILSVKVPDPQFEGQTKTKLGNSEVKGIVDTIMSESLTDYFAENPSDSQLIISKCLQAFQASGTAKQGRDRATQAILPLRGKILNVEKSRIDKILANTEVMALITAMGCSITGVEGEDEEFEIEKARYHKLIIMTDADVDGAHIRTLLLTFFYRHMQGLIDAGYVYVAQPPLYKVTKGKKLEYAYDDVQLERLMSEFGSGYSISRYKGLGEMNAQQLWDTTMDPNQRTLLQVTIEDAEAADKAFVELMGDDVQKRREFIEANATLVANLDI